MNFLAHSHTSVLPRAWTGAGCKEREEPREADGGEEGDRCQAGAGAIPRR